MGKKATNKQKTTKIKVPGMIQKDDDSQGEIMEPNSATLRTKVPKISLSMIKPKFERKTKKVMYSDIYILDQMKNPNFSINPTSIVLLKSFNPGDDSHIPFNPFTYDGDQGIIICPYRNKVDLANMIADGKSDQSRCKADWLAVKARLLPRKFFDIPAHKIKREYNSKNKPHYRRVVVTRKGRQFVRSMKPDVKKRLNLRILAQIASTNKSYRTVAKEEGCSDCYISKLVRYFSEKKDLEFQTVRPESKWPNMRDVRVYLEEHLREQGYFEEGWKTVVKLTKEKYPKLRTLKDSTISQKLRSDVCLRSYSLKRIGGRLSIEDYNNACKGFFMLIIDKLLKDEIIVCIDESSMQVRNFRNRALGFAQLPARHKGPPSQFDLNLLLACSMEKVVAVCSSTRAFNKKSFVFFVKTIVNSSIFTRNGRRMLGNIVLDNSNIHSDKQINELCQKRGISILFSPPKAPQCNPAESVFQLIKSKLRGLFNISRGSLIQIISSAILRVNSEFSLSTFEVELIQSLNFSS